MAFGSQVAVLEGRSLIEHYVSRPADDVSQIHGNIYLGRVEKTLSGIQAAFVDIGLDRSGFLGVALRKRIQPAGFVVGIGVLALLMAVASGEWARGLVR